MGIAYAVDRALTVAVWDGTVTADEWRAHARALTGDPAWRASGVMLTDQRTVSNSSEIAGPILGEVVASARQQASQIAHLRCAVIATRTAPHTVKFSHDMNQALPGMAVFNYLGAACSWLEVNRAEVHAIIAELRGQLRQAR